MAILQTALLVLLMSICVLSGPVEFALASSSSRGVTDVRDSEACIPGDSFDPLECWLYNLEIAIPDFEITEGIFTITISGLYCEHFGISSISSSHSSSQTLNLRLRGLTAECGGHYHISGGLHGDVTMAISDSSAGLSVLFHSDPGFLACL